jgi:ribokinase
MAAYLVFGNLTIDDTVFADGSTAMGTVGGNVLYAATGARIWDADVAMVSRLGRGYPAGLLESMAAGGLRTDGLVASVHHHIRQWQLYDVEGGRTYVPLRSAASYADLTTRAEEIPPSVAAGVRAAHVAPLRVDLQAALVEWLRAKGARITLDPHPDSIPGREAEWRALLPLVDAFLPSQEEAELLLGGWPGPERAARALAGLGPATVCIKLGARGCVLLEGATGPARELPPVAMGIVDPTGCGDAFCGGFLVGWTRTGSPLRGAGHGLLSAGVVGAGRGALHALAVDRDLVRSRLEVRPAAREA